MGPLFPISSFPSGQFLALQATVHPAVLVFVDLLASKSSFRTVTHKIKHLTFWAKVSLKGLELQSQVLPMIRKHDVIVVSAVCQVFQISASYCPSPSYGLSLSFFSFFAF